MLSPSALPSDCGSNSRKDTMERELYDDVYTQGNWVCTQPLYQDKVHSKRVGSQTRSGGCARDPSGIPPPKGSVSRDPDLVASPPCDERSHGVFATRSPRRPNPIGLTVVELLSREGRLLRVRGVDMLEGTPILDIKPYMSSVPAEKLRRGWLEEAEERTRS